ncbi:MAG: class III extradiol ring-cleavage dioxygenase [Alphaproteobacteria bacterium]
MPRPPVLFVSHGSPMLAVEDSPASRYLRGLAATVPRPRTILVLSAHWGSQRPLVGTAAAFETIHDFGGFPDALYRMRYPARGDAAVAARALELLAAAGLDPAPDPVRGLDHGAWVPLILAWPQADVPVVPLSIQPRRDAAHHIAVGRALRPLRDDGVLVLASGAATHNLGALDPRARTAPAWVADFAAWLAGALAARDDAALRDWTRAPSARANHPTPEHLLPLFAAVGAADDGEPGRRDHTSLEYGALAMDCYRFDAAA